jgi:hypothetical protein
MGRRLQNRRSKASRHGLAEGDSAVARPQGLDRAHDVTVGAGHRGIGRHSQTLVVVEGYKLVVPFEASQASSPPKV